MRYFVAALVAAFALSLSALAADRETYSVTELTSQTIQPFPGGRVAVVDPSFSGAVTIAPTSSVVEAQTGAAGVFTNTAASGTTLITLAHSAITTQAVANPSYAGQVVEIVNLAATNAIYLDSGNLALPGSVTLGQWDILRLVGASTSKWVGMTSDN